MDKIDLRAELKHLYSATKKEPSLVEVPEMGFVMFDGTGHPNEADFQKAAEAVFTASYVLKFEIARKKLGIDYGVMPMEVKWHLDKSGDDISFSWTMMVMQPPFITEEMFGEAISLATYKV
jgi:hypothetical protein